MARGNDPNDNYRIFNLNGRVEYVNKIENGYPVLEVHEFCCDEHPNPYIPNVISEGHFYDENTQEPNLLVRNFSFYCLNHNPNNL